MEFLPRRREIRGRIEVTGPAKLAEMGLPRRSIRQSLRDRPKGGVHLRREFVEPFQLVRRERVANAIRGGQKLAQYFDLVRQ